MKIKITFLTCVLFLSTATGWGQSYNTKVYNPDDVDVINAVITNNGLQAKRDDPENWKDIEWNNSSPKRIIKLELSNKNLSGNLNLSKLKALEDLYCVNNMLTSLNLEGVTSLTTLHCSGNQLTSLDLSKASSLASLYCSYNQLTSLDVPQSNSLFGFHCSGNQLTSLDVSRLSNLTVLECSDNRLTSLNLSGFKPLGWIWCQNNQLTSLDLSGLPYLQKFDCSNNQLTSLNVSMLTFLLILDCSYNQLTSLNASKLTNLLSLYCYNNQLTSLELPEFLYNLDCYNNRLTSLDVSGVKNLEHLNCDNNQLTYLNLSGRTYLRFLNCTNNPVKRLVTPKNYTLDISASPSKGGIILLDSYKVGTGKVQLRAAANDNYRLDSWTSSPELALTQEDNDTVVQFVMSKNNQSVTANFIPVIPLITITEQPGSLYLTDSTDLSCISVAANITQGLQLSYQWYASSSYNYNDSTLIRGATDSIFTVSKNLTNGTYYYFCKLSAPGAMPVLSDMARVTLLINTGTEPAEAETLKAYGSNGILHITGIRSGDSLNIYSINGRIMYSIKAMSNEEHIPLSAGLYIIRAGKNRVKSVVK